MFSFLKKKEKNVFEKMVIIAKKANILINSTLSKSDPLIEVEIFIYLYTITDYFFMMNDASNETRVYLNKKTFELLRTTPRWDVISRMGVNELEELLNNRVMNYFKILEKYDKRMNLDYFISCVDYQVQLIANIISNNALSYYNPVPQSPKDYTPMNIDFILINQIKMVLMRVLDDILEYINDIN